MKTAYERAEEFRTEEVPHKRQRDALASRLDKCREMNGNGVFSWNDRWLAVKEIEDLICALIDQRLRRDHGDDG